MITGSLSLNELNVMLFLVVQIDQHKAASPMQCNCSSPGKLVSAQVMNSIIVLGLVMHPKHLQIKLHIQEAGLTAHCTFVQPQL